MLALKGEDPMKIEIMMQKRGEYRPHQEFGINLAVPWSAGTKSDPSYDVSAGSAYTTTQALDDRTKMELGYAGGGSSSAMTVAPHGQSAVLVAPQLAAQGTCPGHAAWGARLRAWAALRTLEEHLRRRSGSRGGCCQPVPRRSFHGL